MEKFIVILLCQAEEPGVYEYVLATRTAFTLEAARAYAATCNKDLQPIVVRCPRGLEFREAQ